MIDCIMYMKIKKIQDRNDFQKDIDKLKEWEYRWGMAFNASKCQVVRIYWCIQRLENVLYIMRPGSSAS